MSKLEPAVRFPPIAFNLVSDGEAHLADYLGHWAMLVVYRGDHCPRCKTYVARLHDLAQAFADRDVSVLLASTDPAPVARRTIDENGWTLPVAHSLSLDDCSTLSLFRTEHDADSDLDGWYAEPGLFIVNPQGLTQVIATSNSPSVRPDLEVVLDGIIGTQDRNLPIRGTLTASP